MNSPVPAAPPGAHAPPHGRVVRRAFVLCLVLPAAALGILETRLRAIRHETITRRPVDAATIPSPGSLRVLALGHAEWAADLMWAAGLVYFGETMATRQQQRYLQRYVEVIEELDPRFRQAYLWGATVSIYNARRIRRESVENAIRHLERGLRAFPDDGEMVHQLGFDYFFELPPHVDDPAERAEMRRRGAEYLRRAAALGYGPPWMALAAAEALQSAGLTDRALEQLRDLYLRTDDPRVRERIAAQIETLQGREAPADPFLEEVRRLDAERRAAFPYLPPMLYLFVGPPVPGVAGPTTPPAFVAPADAGPARPLP